MAAPGLRVLFCGINPGLYSAAVGHHFARPGNRFWKALRAAGFTDRLLAPWENAALLATGIGITNLCPRATARAEELTSEELRTGARARVLPNPSGLNAHYGLPALARWLRRLRRAAQAPRAVTSARTRP